MEDTNQKSENIIKLNNKYMSILKEYDIDNAILTQLKVVNYEFYEDTDMSGSIFLHNENTNDTMEINTWQILCVCQEHTCVYFNGNTLMDSELNSYGGYDDGTQINKDIITKLGIPMYNEKLSSSKYDCVIYKIQAGLINEFIKIYEKL